MLKIDKYKELLIKKYDKIINPDYIFITIYDEKYFDLYNNEYLTVSNIKNFDKIKYDNNLLKLKNFKLNDNNYILDSCILNNYNANINKIPAHSIAGITCKNNNYFIKN